MSTNEKTGDPRDHKVSVQLPKPPLRGGADASQALSLRTHAAGGPSVEPAELENDVNSLQAEWELPEPQFVYLACQAVALLNMDPMLKTLEVSHEPMA